MTSTYHGVIVPMVTPFTSDGRIDETSLTRITEYIIEYEAFPFVFGTTGESASIPDALRPPAVKRVVKVSDGKCMVYAGISSNRLQTAIDAAKLYFDIGADVVVAHLPSYYTLTHDQILIYYERLAEQIDGPIMLYNIKNTTHMSIPLEVADKLSHHPNIVGIKDSERNQQRLEKAIAMWRDRPDFSYFVGWGTQLAHGLLLGSNGIVPSSANVAPGLCKKLYDTAVAGKAELAADLQIQHDRISQVYQKNRTLGQSLAALKTMMAFLGLCQPHVLPPLTQLSEVDQKTIAAAMDRIELVKQG